MSDPADPRRSIDLDLDYFRHRIHQRGHTMRYRWDTTSPISGRWSGPAATSNLRVSDAERNEVADKLSRHFADGRLDQTEFKERLDAAMSAKTQDDLAGLFDDLPRLPSQAAPAASHRRRRLLPFLLIVAFVALAAGVSLPFTSGLHLGWLFFVLIGLFIWTRFGHHHHHSHRSDDT
jgi:hypothetical protein